MHGGYRRKYWYMTSVLARRAGAAQCALLRAHPRTFVTLGPTFTDGMPFGLRANLGAARAVSDVKPRSSRYALHADPKSATRQSDAAPRPDEVQTWPFRNFFDSELSAS